MGSFTYQTYETHTVDTPYEMDNPGLYYYFTQDVASIVKRASALELEKSGVILNQNAKLELSGCVEKLYFYTIGGNFTDKYCDYTIRYIIKDRMNGNILFSKAFSPPRIIMPLMPVENIPSVLSSAILQGYEMFIADANVQQLLLRQEE